MINEQLLNIFKETLKKEGMKYTLQRKAVFEELMASQDHRECEDIYLSIKNQSKHVSRATVYRTMDILVQNNLARRLDLGKSSSLYERKINSPHHDHLICTSCGKIMEFIDEEIERLQENIAQKYNFNITRHIHQLFGICKQCQ